MSEPLNLDNIERIFTDWQQRGASGDAGVQRLSFALLAEVRCLREEVILLTEVRRLRAACQLIVDTLSGDREYGIFPDLYEAACAALDDGQAKEGSE